MKFRIHNPFVRGKEREPEPVAEKRVLTPDDIKQKREAIAGIYAMGERVSTEMLGEQLREQGVGQLEISAIIAIVETKWDQRDRDKAEQQSKTG